MLIWWGKVLKLLNYFDLSWKLQLLPLSKHVLNYVGNATLEYQAKGAANQLKYFLVANYFVTSNKTSHNSKNCKYFL